MTNTIPPDWVLIEAAKRANHILTPAQLRAGLLAKAARPYFDALCEMIMKHEQPPRDRKFLCAREAEVSMFPTATKQQVSIHAIELWEMGFEK